MSRGYTRAMKTFRYLIAAALLATLAACGNKGPLVKASQAAADAAVAPADTASPPATEPTEVAPPEEVPAPPATDPASTTPPDVPPADDGGNG